MLDSRVEVADNRPRAYSRGEQPTFRYSRGCRSCYGYVLALVCEGYHPLHCSDCSSVAVPAVRPISVHIVSPQPIPSSTSSSSAHPSVTQPQGLTSPSAPVPHPPLYRYPPALITCGPR